MHFLEFVEAIARVAEKISPSSPSHKVKNLNPQRRRVLPLFVKFEGLVYTLYHLLKQQLFKVYEPGHKLLAFDRKLIGSSFLQTTEARKMGIFQKDSSSDEEEHSEDAPLDNMSVFSNQSLLGAEQVIWKQLFYEDEIVAEAFETARNTGARTLRRRQTLDQYQIQKYTGMDCRLLASL
jgi:hypothetical protein